jgi:hypothetical protein
MNQHDIDAFVSTVRAAIDQRLGEFRKELEGAQFRQLVQVAKNAVRTDAEQIQQHLTKLLNEAVAAIPAPQPVSAEDVAKAVADYMAAHPVEVPKAPEAPAPLAPTAEQVAKAVAEHMEANPLEVPFEALEAMVKDYMAAHPVEVPKAPEPLAPRPEDIAQAVAKHLADNPPKDGARGLDAVEINILPRIDPERRYAKGTYAKHAAGLWRAAIDTAPGDDPALCGWEPVIEGVKAIEVHQLDPGVIAVKSVMTCGESHIAKIELPAMEYKGVWRESEGEYRKGHTVTQSGSLWHCNRPTTDKPGTSDAWTLCAKAGRDGKDINVARLPRPATYSLEGTK